MKIKRTRSGLLSLAGLPLAISIAVIGAGCGSGSGATGTGGVTGSGGASTATGGRSGSGGQTGSGGQPGTGGAQPGGNTGTDAGAAGAGVDGGSTDGSSDSRDGGSPDAPGLGGNGGRGGAGGAGGRGGVGGGGGGIAFAPCPTNGTACVILPLGDSITDGFPFEQGGYRVELFHQTRLNSQGITFVGSLANGPTPPTVDGVTFPRNHEGHSGYTIDNAPTFGRAGLNAPVAITDMALANYRPHIVLLMIGTNDMNLGVDLPNAPARLGTLLDRIITGAPNALIVVAQITPTNTAATNLRIQTYNAAIPGLVQQRAAAGKHVIMVNMYTTFTANPNYSTALMNDDLHPNAAGYALLGQTWYAAIRTLLPPGP